MVKLSSFYKVLRLSLLVIILIIVITNIWIILATSGRVYEDINDIPERKVAIVLGTSKSLISGKDNPYFDGRIKMAAELYRKAKVKHFIVSGDNSEKYYNEPKDMRDALIRLGVPYTAITLDYAGFRTLDSIVRCKKVFDQEEIIIVTQKFHSYRAVFIGSHYDINSIAAGTKDLPLSYSFKVLIREVFARTLTIADLYILRKDPKFLGPKEDLSAN